MKTFTKFLNVIALSLLTTGAMAQTTYYVNVANPTPGDGKSWSAAFTNLQAALDMATSGNQIFVAKGIYKPSKIFAPGVASPGTASPNNRYNTFQLSSGVAIYGGYDDQGNGTRNISANETILSGDLGVANDNTDNAYNVVIIAEGTTGVLLDGFTISDGYASGSTNRTNTGASHLTYYGGGIYLRNGDGVFRNLRLLRNGAKTNNSTLYGGGFFLATTSTNLVELDNIEFIQNQANSVNSVAHGGALYLGGTNLKLNRLKFISNMAKSAGGAIFASTAATNIKLGNSVFYDNSAGTNGGAICFSATASAIITATIVNSTFYQNSGDIGGAIFMVDHANNTLDIRNTILLGNTASTSDADISKGNSANLTISHSLTQSYNPNNIASVVTEANPTNVFINTTNVDHEEFLRLKRNDTNPAIDAGDNNQYDLVMFGTKDLAGGDRIFNSGLNPIATIDMGAYENGVTPLPIELLRYDVKLKDNKAVLSWATSWERNSSHYTIERGASLDDFKFLKKIQAAGNATNEQNYQITDEAPLAGTSYYRLTQYDLDGTPRILGIKAISLSFTGTSSWIYPNPASKSVSIRLPETIFGPIQIDLISLNGTVVLSKKIEKNTNYALDISNVNAGTYVLHIKSNYKNEKHKLLVVN